MNEYTPVGWLDYPQTSTPITASNLNQMEDGITSVTNEVINLENGTSVATTASKLGTSTIGSSTAPIYLNSGNPVACTPATTVSSSSSAIVTSSAVYSACTNGTVSKVGTSTVGSATKPIYLASGTPTAFSSTVGSATKPVYMNSGTITACSATVGNSTTPVYMNAGVLTACSESITQPIIKLLSYTEDNIDVFANDKTSIQLATEGSYASDYEILGMVGYRILNATSNGAYSKNVHVKQMYSTGSNVWLIELANTTDTDATIKFTGIFLVAKDSTVDMS